MIDRILQELFRSQNQFASGGLLLLIVGAIGASFKSAPLAIWKWILNQTTTSVTITDDSQAFYWFKHWFQEQGFASKVRRIDAYTPYVRGGYQPLQTPAPGVHWIWHKNRPFRMVFTRSEDKKVFGSRAESLYIQTLGRNPEFMREFIKETFTTYKEVTKDATRLFVFDGKQWVQAFGFSPRPLDSVVLANSQKQDIVQDFQKFLSSEDWYEKRGVPYRRGYLLHGLPGMGKTSLVNGLASEFKTDVYVICPNEVSDTQFSQAISQVGARSIILLEDVDCAVHGRKNISSGEKETKGEGANHVTLSGLLNVLDGIQTPRGVTFFMTTNNIEKLDAALIRPGRCDVKIYFGEATKNQKTTLYKMFFPSSTLNEAESFVENNSATTIAEFQEKLLSYRESRAND